MLFYYLHWSYLGQTEFETFLFSLFSFVYSCKSPLVVMEIWADWTASLFPNVGIAQSDTFREGSTPFFTHTGLESPWDKHGRCSHRWNLSFLYQPVDCCNLSLFGVEANQKSDVSVKAPSMGGDSNGRHKYSPDIFYKYSYTQRMAAFLLFINTRQMCGKPNSPRSLSWKRERQWFRVYICSLSCFGTCCWREFPAPTACPCWA